jgi:TRAP-type C4-dicarboxylate transport system substrate-binding protein
LYKKLTAAQRDFVNSQARRMETELEEWKAYNADDAKRQAQAGIQTIQLTGAEATRYLDKAYEVGWAEAIKKSPEHGPALRKLISK